VRRLTLAQRDGSPKKEKRYEEKERTKKEKKSKH
jgi:hypothetical protein